ncbi:MAG: SMC family ATPase [Candidatus Dormiibacterota bacterium]
MRPVLLEMHGFAAFREPATVDFRDAEYFALVGPTGSGKSTVIDAMTFALYGSVPRWDDQKVVKLALAPSVNRGTVRLVFDAGDARYVVARELRRSAKGGVTVRSARLERLGDRTGTGEAGDGTEVLAAESAVTKAVEELLGLPFDQFCMCVVLPQGDFAEFLHAKPAVRQQMLTRLLGLGVYESIAKEANREAVVAGERAEVLAGQLAGYADATEEAVSGAEARVTALGALSERVIERLPELVTASHAVTTADGVVERLRDERARLTALAAPDGLPDLDARQRLAADEAGAARRRCADAEAADTEAREQRAAAPDRGPLERARQNHAELATALADRPGAQQSQAGAGAAYAAAVAAAAEAADAVEDARTTREVAASDLAAAYEVAQRFNDECELLIGLCVPTGLEDLDGRRRAAEAELVAAQQALDSADAVDTHARGQLSAAPARGPLERARDDYAALAATQRALPGADEAHLVAVRDRESAAAAVADTSERLRHARIRRDGESRADLAAALRPSLVAGQPCPVCDQAVATLPAARPTTDLSRADAAVADAEEALEQARRVEAGAVAAERELAGERDRLADELERLHTVLASAPPSATAVSEALASLDVLVAATEQAAAALRDVRRRRDNVAAAMEAIRGESAAAASALWRAREPLVPLGAPPVVDDVLAGWYELCAWADQEAAVRGAALAAARVAAAEAAEAAQAAKLAFDQVERTATAMRAEETAAARAEQHARSDLDALDQRIEQLQGALETELPDAEGEAALHRLDALDAAVRRADAELRAARDARLAADARLVGVGRDIATAWAALHAARDPLVVLGAPAVTGDDLLAAWTALTGWATAAIARRDGELPDAQSAAAAAREDRDAAGRRLADDVATHDVLIPSDRPVAASVLAAVAEAFAGSRGLRDRIVERRADAARLRAQRSDAESVQQVARMLGNLLRSDNFPRWLVASALDVLVADASESLSELSGGQFELTHDDGEFLIVDHADADAKRPVKTLSGGETFQASLALALALSAQLSALAAQGAAHLDSIFLDEGFGTLDEATLDVVATTLENLATRGNRMVGVITHVPTLAERVPVRFAVTRDQHTASVVREVR